MPISKTTAPHAQGREEGRGEKPMSAGGGGRGKVLRPSARLIDSMSVAVPPTAGAWLPYNFLSRPTNRGVSACLYLHLYSFLSPPSLPCPAASSAIFFWLHRVSKNLLL
uniref:Uncharacterized protein n=1 Tax=Trypanosoma vivax (strain Y486) TaxID=1055687 RepID=G0U7E9_TRYVY|nr:hypothetical protein TVY486_1008530 [Trypanosoma vivax Y486]